MPPATIAPTLPIPNESITGSVPKHKRGECLDDNDKPNMPNPVELQLLMLPSELSSNLRSACHTGLEEIEMKMRDAQCRISLDHIQMHLYMESGLTTYKQRHAQHQKENTRARKTIDDNDAKIRIFQDKYNTARKALIALGANEVEMEWRDIKDADLRCLEDDEMNEKHDARSEKQAEKQVKKGKGNTLSGPGTGEGRRKLLWIWEGAGRDLDTLTGLHEGADKMVL
jgi:hypothetical protein